MRFENLERRLALSTSSINWQASPMTASAVDNSSDAPMASKLARVAGPVASTGSLQKPTTPAKSAPAKPDGVGPAPLDSPPSLSSPGTTALALAAEPIAGGGIHLQWRPLGLLPEGQIIIFRKSPSETDWTAGAIAEPAYNATSYDDLTAVTGVAYEYKVVTYSELGAAPNEKYILAGNAVAPVHSRGTVLLVVEATQLDPNRDSEGTTLLPALGQYQADLIAEGYRVRVITAPRIDVPRGIPSDPNSAEAISAYFGAWSNSVMSLKAQIRAIYQQTPDLSSIFLIGHVPVPYSGLENPDGAAHALSHGAWPADVFYGSLSIPDSAWTDTIDSELGDGVNRNLPGDGKFDQDLLLQLYAGTELENTAFTDVPVGRIDFAMLPPFKGLGYTSGASAPVEETRLLARYLEKDHQWRTGQWNVDHKALFEEQFPFPEYYDTNRLTPNVGLGNIVAGLTGPVEDPAHPAPQHYDLTEKSWLWMYAGAAGYPNYATLHFSLFRELHINHYINGAYAQPGTYAADVDEGSHKAVFNFIYGSYVGDWNQPQSLLRTVIAEPDGLGLASMWGARPRWNQHRMALGQTIGDSLERTINNFGLREAYDYDPYESSTRLALMGDPTLRQENVLPPTGVTTAANTAGAGTTVSWTASADPSVAGYYVYRASSPAGPFTLLNATMTAGTSYLDTTASPGTETYYLVRASRLQASASGTYWNLSLGAMSAPRVTNAHFIGNTKPQTIDVTFDQDVSNSLTAADFVISGQRRDFATGSNVPISFTAGVDFHLVSFDTLTRTARIQFDVNNELGVHGLVPSGRYTLSFATSSVTNAFGVPLPSGYSFAFGSLTGDTNGDLRVDFSDLVVLAQQYGRTVTGGSLSGDFNNDGVVNFDDLVVLAQHYGTIL
jgi:hypothetical protein